MAVLTIPQLLEKFGPGDAPRSNDYIDLINTLADDRNAVYFSATAPTDTDANPLWFDTSNNLLFIYNGEWVESSGSGGASITVSDNAPLSPEEGALWYDSSSAKSYIYYDSFWVELAPATQGEQGIQGEPGATGDDGIVQSATEPSNTDQLWLDTDDTAEPLAIPAGGTAGQILQKSTDGDYDTAWSNVPSHNYIINGAFDIWQRGTSLSSLSNDLYLADRWATRHSGSPASRVTSQEELTPADINAIGYGEGKYYIRQTLAGSVTYVRNTTKIEDVRTLAGQEITISFWARSSGSVTAQPIVIQDFGVGGSSPTANFIASNVTLTSNWQRYTFTEAIYSIAGKTIGDGSNLTIIFQFDGLADGTLDLWGVQLEAGSIATPFKRNANSIQGELAACQRYYQIYGTQANEFLTTGFCYSTSQSLSTFNFVQEMRVAPTISFSAASDFGLYAVGASSKTVTAIAAGFASTKSFRLQANIGTTDLGAGNATNVFSGSGGGRVEVDAEL